MTAPVETLRSRRKNNVLTGVFFTLLVLVAYATPLLTRRNFAGRDLLPYNVPLEMSIHDAYSRGRLPVWTPEISGGRPLLPNPNAGALYPLRPILAQIPFPVAMRIYPVIHWVVAGLGMIALLLLLGASRAGAWIGAVTYAFSGVAVAEVFFPHILPGMSLLPWAVWAMQRQARSEGIRLLTLALVFGLLVLAGDVFTIGIAVGACLLWIGIERPKNGRARDILVLCTSLLLAGLIAAPQIIATGLWVPQTNRAISGMKLGHSFYLTIAPIRLLELVVPFVFGPTWSLDLRDIWGWAVFRNNALGLFTTLYAGALAVIALLVSWKWRPHGARFARVLFLVTLAVSVIPSLMPAKWENVPSPLPLRNPEKFAVAMVFALGILAGHAFDRLRTAARLPRYTLAVALLLALLAGASALFPEHAGALVARNLGANERLTRIAERQIPPALAEGGLLWIATVIALHLCRLPRRVPLTIGLFLLSAVPLAANRKIAQTLREEDVFSPTPFARFLQRVDPAGRYRAVNESFYQTDSRLEDVQPIPLGDGAWTYHRQGVWRRGTVLNFDFDAGDLARVESLRRISVKAAGFKDSQQFFAALALKWGIRFRDQRPLPGYRLLRANGLHYWDELPEALPDIRLVERWREEVEPLAAATLIPRLRPGEVVLETGSRREGSSRGGVVRVLVNEPEHLVLETESLDPTWVFVLRGFWPYRTVILDGRPTDVVPAQLAFSAVAVPAGHHRIDWREEVPGGSVSRWGPVVFALLMAALLVRERRIRTSAP